MTILVTGASGFIGKALCKELKKKKIKYISLSRKSSLNSDNIITWDIHKGLMDTKFLKEVEIVINLSGEPIGQRWTDPKKKQISYSRIEGTKLLIKNLNKNCKNLKKFITASGTSFYGSSYSETFDEFSPKGKGFLSDLVLNWEDTLSKIELKNCDKVFMRIAPVLGKNGGFLKKLLPIFKIGFGASIGSSRQFMSWIYLDDLIKAIIFFIENDNVSGVFNLASPNAVTNSEFTKTLGLVLNRPTLFNIPSFFLKLIYGEMSTETLLVSQKVLPTRLIELGFNFENEKLKKTLKKCI